jgi:hypothetical protein
MKIFDIDPCGSFGFKFYADREYQVLMDYRNHTTEEGIWCVRVDFTIIFMFLGERCVIEQYHIIPLTSITDSDLFGSVVVYVLMGKENTKFTSLVMQHLMIYSGKVKHPRSSLIV